jgi:Ca2+-binding EF-hand superfamily protein
MEEVIYLLADFGIITQCTILEKKGIEKDLVGLVRRLGNKETEPIPFADFLACISLMRKRLVDQYVDTVATLFLSYDRDRSGELETKEVCLVIQDLQLLPRTLAEQDAIAELLEESDVDGSGSLQFEEVLLMITRIVERTNMIQRAAENAKAESLNLTWHQTYELRRAFETLDFDNSGALTFSEVCKAAQMMQWRISDMRIHQFFCEFDKDDTGSINFVEFLSLMCRVDQDLNAASQDDRSANDADQHKTAESHTKQDDQAHKSMKKALRQTRSNMSVVDSRKTLTRRQVTRGALGL